jgi:hypothetical protein
MKYLRKFNESVEQQIYGQVLDTIKDCFLEFEDRGWYWLNYEGAQSSISIYDLPNINCIMYKKEDEYVPSELRKEYIDWTGKITSDGEIIWDSKELKRFDYFTEGPLLEEAEDFLTAVKRLQSETGLDFKFSYNNKGGEMGIIIQGRI